MRFEHLAINVADAPAVIKWYTETLGLIVMRSMSEPPYTTFLADPGQNMMFEFYQQPVPVADYAGIHPTAFHIAFLVDDIVAERARIIAAGGKPEGEITTTPAGDKLCFIRDPWNVTLQLVMRQTLMLAS